MLSSVMLLKTDGENMNITFLKFKQKVSSFDADIASQ